MRIVPSLLVIAVSLVAPCPGWAGTLRMDAPSINEDQIIVPVAIEGDVGDGVAALDFYFNYDPAVFEPVGVAVGQAAEAAGKQVHGNLTSPGQYRVVLLGLNQSSVTEGQVAKVVLRRVGQPETGRSELTISGSTLSSPDALPIPSSGSTRTVDLPSSNRDDDQGGEGQQDGNENGDSGEEQDGKDPDQDKEQDDQPGTDAEEEGTSGGAGGVIPGNYGSGQALPIASLPGGNGPSAPTPEIAGSQRPLDLTRLAQASESAAARRAGIPTHASSTPADASGSTASAERQGAEPAGVSARPGTMPETGAAQAVLATGTSVNPPVPGSAAAPMGGQPAGAETQPPKRGALLALAAALLALLALVLAVRRWLTSR